MPRDTGLPSADAQFDFSRARRAARARAPVRAAPPRRGREPHPALRGGRARTRPHRRAAPRRAADPARLDRGDGRPLARVRPLVPAHVAARARALAADQPGAAQGSVDAADRRLQDRRPALRQGRPPPRVGGPRARLPRHQRVRDRGAHRGRRRPRDPPEGPAAEEPPAALLRARAAAARGARAHPPERRMALRRAGRGGGGVGLPRHPGAPGGDVTPRGRRGLVPRGVRAGRADARTRHS